MTLYNLKQSKDKYIITKFDGDLEVQSSYEVNGGVCTCPAGTHGRYCRHKEMQNYFIEQGRVDSPWFFEYPEHKWWYLDADRSTFMEEPPRPKWRRI